VIKQNSTWLEAGYSEHGKSYSPVTGPPPAMLCHQASSALSVVSSLNRQSAASNAVLNDWHKTSLVTIIPHLHDQAIIKQTLSKHQTNMKHA